MISFAKNCAHRHVLISRLYRMMAAFSVSVLLEILRAMIDLNSEKESDNIEKRIYSKKVVIVKAKANMSFQI